MSMGGRVNEKTRNMPIARNKKNFRSTKSGAGMTRAGVAKPIEEQIPVQQIKNSGHWQSQTRIKSC